MNNQVHPASFRDPAGFLFTRQGVLYRQVNRSYQADYDLLVTSGLLDELVARGMLVPSQEVDQAPELPDLAYKILRPEKIWFISYPYEWCFSQLKDAALRTLAIQRRALKKGMSLKDASAYNLQFQDGRLLLIDTLSFEAYQPGQPWVAYRQFCQHFLAPLALMAHCDVRLEQLLRVYIDGIPLDLASRLLPLKTRLNPGLSTHIHLHASFQKKHADSGITTASRSGGMSLVALQGLIESLRNTIHGLKWRPRGTEWGEYYTESSGHYSESAAANKLAILEAFLDQVKPTSLWDLGANTGLYSRIASQRGIPSVAFDIDPAAVEQGYLQVKADKETHLLPLVLDLTNPSPAIGWANRERMDLLARGPVDMLLALALVHHLAIGNNLPLARIAEFFAQATQWLVIEFVPREDPQVQRLLSSRLDIFSGYNQAGFEAAFGEYFELQQARPVLETHRLMYLMKRRG